MVRLIMITVHGGWAGKYGGFTGNMSAGILTALIHGSAYKNYNIEKEGNRFNGGFAEGWCDFVHARRARRG